MTDIPPRCMKVECSKMETPKYNCDFELDLSNVPFETKMFDSGIRIYFNEIDLGLVFDEIASAMFRKKNEQGGDNDGCYPE